MSENLLQQILDEIKVVKSEQQIMKDSLKPVEKRLTSIEDTLSRMEVKQDVIYTQTGSLTEETETIKGKLADIEKHLVFNTQKIAATELELFKLKRD